MIVYSFIVIYDIIQRGKDEVSQYN